MTPIPTKRATAHQCPAKAARKFCSAAVNGACTRGFDAIDRKGNCYRKRVKKAGAGA